MLFFKMQSKNTKYLKVSMTILINIGLDTNMNTFTLNL